MTEQTSDKTIEAFLFAKKHVFDHGYASEVQWQESANFKLLNERGFLSEAAWVILNSGMRETVIRGLFPRISEIFFKWKSAEVIMQNEEDCVTQALKLFNNPGKISAIVQIADDLRNAGFDNVKSEILQQGICRIQCYPYMGKATSYHFAKNIGLNFAKPDRHLLRIAEVAGFDSPQKMCEEVAMQLGEKVSVVDLIFWRFATLNENYLKIFGNA